MSWKELINENTGVWAGVREYAADRTRELTQTCVAPESSEAQIRQAQAGILELHRLTELPSLIKAEGQQRAQQTKRKEY